MFVRPKEGPALLPGPLLMGSFVFDCTTASCARLSATICSNACPSPQREVVKIPLDLIPEYTYAWMTLDTHLGQHWHYIFQKLAEFLNHALLLIAVHDLVRHHDTCRCMQLHKLTAHALFRKFWAFEQIVGHNKSHIVLAGEDGPARRSTVWHKLRQGCWSYC